MPITMTIGSTAIQCFLLVALVAPPAVRGVNGWDDNLMDSKHTSWLRAAALDHSKEDSARGSYDSTSTGQRESQRTRMTSKDKQDKGNIFGMKSRDSNTRGGYRYASPKSKKFPKSHKSMASSKKGMSSDDLITKGVASPTKGKGQYPSSKGKGTRSKGTPYKGASSKGTPSKRKDVSAKGKGKGDSACSICSSDCIGVDSFQLVDASRNVRLQTIHPSDNLFLPELEMQYGTTEFAIECVTIGNVGSVSISDNFGGGNIDNLPPWTLAGDDGGDFLPTPLADNPGFWYVICQPFCGPDASGVTGRPIAAMFRVIGADEMNLPTAAPVAATIAPIPTLSPVAETTLSPTSSPVFSTTMPTSQPTFSPDSTATFPPTSVPTTAPTVAPTTSTPTITPGNTAVPTGLPTSPPTSIPTVSPIAAPTSTPTVAPVAAPTRNPTSSPTVTVEEAGYGLQPNCFVFDEARFNICLDLSSLSGNPEPWFDLVQEASDRWQRIISSDPWGPWPLATLEFLSDDLVATELPVDGVDDIYIAVFEENIDGSGGLFALAGPNLILADQIIAGSIQIDPNDIPSALDNNIFLPLMLHEIGHVLGIGTLWDDYGLTDGNTYVGTNAVDAWQNEVGCSGDLPIEGAHWDEDCMQNEFMTPFFRFNRPAPVSSITMGTLEDLGYDVNRGEEDAFGVDDLGSCGNSCPEANRRLNDFGSSTKSTSIQRNKLSAEGEAAVLVAAANHFRGRPEFTEGSDGTVTPLHNTLAAVYQEDGKFHSRVISRKDVNRFL